MLYLGIEILALFVVGMLVVYHGFKVIYGKIDFIHQELAETLKTTVSKLKKPTIMG